LIEGGLPTEAMIAHVLVTKYADHVPLYRQSQIYARQGIELDRWTLADWVGRAAAELRPLHERLFAHLKRSPKLFMDETAPRRCSLTITPGPAHALWGQRPSAWNHHAQNPGGALSRPGGRRRRCG
jgi:hypothetical protein